MNLMVRYNFLHFYKFIYSLFQNSLVQTVVERKCKRKTTTMKVLFSTESNPPSEGSRVIRVPFFVTFSVSLFLDFDGRMFCCNYDTEIYLVYEKVKIISWPSPLFLFITLVLKSM